ncbi:MAG: hypothetical protein OXB95_12565, partial [Rhodobacteraceae bacterium]|nr:hypothetical protein [Paracoccaceae bacterium]
LAKWRTDMAESMAKLIAMQAEQGAKLIAWQAEQDAKLIAWQAEQDAKLEKRDKSNFQWLVGMWIAFVVVICIIVRWPVG